MLAPLLVVGLSPQFLPLTEELLLERLALLPNLSDGRAGRAVLNRQPRDRVRAGGGVHEIAPRDVDGGAVEDFVAGVARRIAAAAEQDRVREIWAADEGVELKIGLAAPERLLFHVGVA